MRNLETPAEGNVENDVESADANENTDENGKEEQQTEAPVEVSSEQPRGLSEISCYSAFYFLVQEI